MKIIVKTTFLAIGLLATTSVQAENALVTANVNLRIGPGARYTSIGSIPNGALVRVQGCTSGYGWCQVVYGPNMGWAASRYLALKQRTASRPSVGFGVGAAAVGIPIVSGVMIESAFGNRPYYNDDNYLWDRRFYQPYRHGWYRPWRHHSGWGWDRPYRRPEWDRRGWRHPERYHHPR